jgi:hypothetical protein
MVTNRLIAVILDLKPLCLLVKRSILKLHVLFRMNKEDFSQAKDFIFSDIERELQLARTDLGTDYKTFRILGNDVYGIFRCGLAHEYYVKGNCTIFMLSQGSRLGIGKDSCGTYWFIVEKYFQDFNRAFELI